MRSLLLVILVLAPLAACGDEDEDAEDTLIQTTTSSVASTGATTTTTAFDGATTPTSAASTASSVALLIGVEAAVEDGVDRVTFTFRDELPGFDIGYVEPPIRADGSGEEVAVEGSAFLSVRLEPASGVDLAGEEAEQTYAGPDRLALDSTVVEVVRTGDFEANLTWVLGLIAEVPYRVETTATTLSIVALSR